MTLKDRALQYAGIFLISLAVLLFQISLTRIFSLILFSNYAFMIISTAMFGMGLSGVILAVFPGIMKKFNSFDLFFVFSALFSATVLGSFLVINNVPLKMAELKSIKNLMALAIYYFSLMTPFAFAGMVIALLFTKFTKDISKLYFFDLIGAGLGCLLTVPFFIKFGGTGTLFLVAIMGVVSGTLFSMKERKWTRVAGPLLIIILGLVYNFSWKDMQINVHEQKRSYRNDQINKTIEFSRWSSLSKIDIAPGPKPFFKRLWIDGGTNESALISFDGTLHTEYLGGMDKLLIALPYLLKTTPEVAIIGSSGGREVLLARNHDPKHITAIEMDPTICKIVSEIEEYANYTGNLFNDPKVTLVCDEGRSFIKRSDKKFDIIHQVNNFTPIAMASGAINLSESYLLTKEAFNDYLERLTDNGMLVLNRHNTFKIVILAIEVLKEHGLNPADHLVVITGEDQLNNGFYMKKTPFTEEEITSMLKIAKDMNLAPLYYPGFEQEGNWYVKLLKSNDYSSFLKLKGLNLEPPTDDKPFFEHIGSIGRINVDDPYTPRGLHWVAMQKKLKATLPVEDMILIAILIEASLFSLIFIFGPLIIFKKRGVNPLKEHKTMFFFFSIGISYILLEICLMQKFVLFLGVPVYAIAVVLFSLLSATGCGSLSTGKIKSEAKGLKTAVTALFIYLLAANYLMPPMVNMFLGKSLPVRILISFLVIFPQGFIMGMFFPLGMRILDKTAKELIPWAWGINGYATVIGSVLAIAFARVVGFKMVFILAGVLYILGVMAINKLAVED